MEGSILAQRERVSLGNGMALRLLSALEVLQARREAGELAGEDRERWEAGVAPLGADRARRCRACYALRLAEACRVAQERGFEFVGTTLAVSPYQLFETCNDVLERLAAARGLTPVIRDFRTYYPEATRRSRELGMYRQNYCGCRFSAVEAAMDRARIRDERKASKK